MSKLKKLVIAAALLGAALSFKPRTAEAIDWCKECNLRPTCFSCCRCDGYTTYECAGICP